MLVVWTRDADDDREMDAAALLRDCGKERISGKPGAACFDAVRAIFGPRRTAPARLERRLHKAIGQMRAVIVNEEEFICCALSCARWECYSAGRYRDDEVIFIIIRNYVPHLADNQRLKRH